MKYGDRHHLETILEATKKIESYTADGKDVFLVSDLIMDAVAKRFEVIGESVKSLSENLKSRHPEIPWRRIAGFRDVLSHDYDIVEPSRVWETIEQHLPALKAVIEAELPDHSR